MSINLEKREELKGLLIQNVDYGFIPNIPKPVLFKSGAEKIAISLSLDVKLSIVKFEPEFVAIECKLLNNEGVEVINAFGSAEMSEPKFSPIDRKSGEIIKKGNNQILKMAQKRAFVSAILMYAGLSSGFDLEGGEDEEIEDKRTLHQRTTNSNDRITELKQMISKCYSLKDIKNLNEQYGKDITALGLTNELEDQKKKAWQNWFNQFTKDLEACETAQDIEQVQTKYKWLIENKDYKGLCEKLIKEIKVNLKV